jgi:hypothetical protein
MDKEVYVVEIVVYLGIQAYPSLSLFVGVFDTKELAEAACKSHNYAVIPRIMNSTDKPKTMWWPIKRPIYNDDDEEIGKGIEY